MKNDIPSIRLEAERMLESCTSLAQLEEIRVTLLGRKGSITRLLRSLKDFSPEERPLQGKRCNELKKYICCRIEQMREKLEAHSLNAQFSREAIDVTLPGVPFSRGAPHPLSATMDQIISIFTGVGFTVEEGPEIESEYYNFTALNFPPDHPAKDMQDTLYLHRDYLMRTHTSPVQIRVMQSQKPPLRCIMPGRVYRCDYDVSHSPMFHQVEGLCVGEGIDFAQLKGILVFFVQSIIGTKTTLRFRPSFFPFTEPSAEIDISCVMCEGRGCRVCSHSGWLEILGAGMVHPAVLEGVEYDPEIFTGYAFGMGVERIAMLKYGIDDIRLFFENDMRFLAQFRGSAL